MFPYLVIFILCSILFSHSSRKRTMPLLIACIILSLFAGFRDVTVGADTDFYPHWYVDELVYVNSFSDILKLDTDLDKGYLFLYWVGSWLSNQYWIGLFLTEFVISLFTFLAFLRLNKHFNGNIVLFALAFLFLIFNYTLNAMRQECAISIAFYAFTYFWERKWLPYLLWTLVAISFHLSALISLGIPVLYYISFIKDTNRRRWITILSTILMILVIGSFYYVLNMIAGLGILNNSLAERYGENGAFEGTERVAYAPLAISLICYYIMYLSYKKRLLDVRILIFHFLLNTSYLLALFLSTLSMYLYRVGLYFYILDLFLLVVELSSKKISLKLRYSIISVFVFYWFFSYIIKNNGETYPYTSSILGVG